MIWVLFNNHIIDGVGFPEASQFKVKESPCKTSWLLGNVVITGGTWTSRVMLCWSRPAELEATHK